MNKKFNIEVYEANLDENFFPVATRQFAVSIMNYVGENKDANVQLIKDGCQELIKFYEENGDTDNFEPYKYDLTNEEKRIAGLEKENAELKEQLKNSIVPKFKDVVYVLDGDILEECFVDKIFILNDGSIYYEIYNFKGTRLSKLFKSDGVGVYTEAEAQKYLEEVCNTN